MSLSSFGVVASIYFRSHFACKQPMIRRVCVCVCVCVCVLRNVRYNKATVLRESVAYIRQLQEDNRRLSATEMDHTRLMHVNWTLSRRLKVPSALLYSTTQP